MNRKLLNKIYYILVLIILFGWIIYSFIPIESCHQERFADLFLHWDVCEDMSFVMNFLFIVFDIFLTLGSAFLIVLSILFLNKFV